MRVYHRCEKIEYPFPAIALGNFDGFHLGHKEVMYNAKKNGKSFGALLFRKHTALNVKSILTLDDKLSILSDLGADFAYIVDFDEKFKNMTCGEFCSFLFKIGVKTVSVGYDYRCGRGAAADAAELTAELKGYDIATVVTPPVLKNSMPVKSSYIRELITDGRVDAANELMTRPFKISGKVVRGFQNGRLLGYPTANIEVDDGQLLPKDGVYCCECRFADKTYGTVLNIGKNPTFNADKRTVEAHILGYGGELYGDEITVNFYRRIRDEKKFTDTDALSAQIQKDVDYVNSWRESRLCI